MTGSLIGTAKVWDAESGDELLTLNGHTGWIYTASYSPDGTRIVTGNSDGTTKVWNAVSGEELLTLSGYGDWVTSASYSTDGTRIVTGR